MTTDLDISPVTASNPPGDTHRGFDDNTHREFLTGATVDVDEIYDQRNQCEKPVLENMFAFLS